MLSDQIAILVIFFSTICTEVTAFVNEWNSHCICKQPKRLNFILGRLYTLFYHPQEGISNYGVGLYEPTLLQLRQDVKDCMKQELVMEFYSCGVL